MVGYINFLLSHLNRTAKFGLMIVLDVFISFYSNYNLNLSVPRLSEDDLKIET